MAGAGAMTGFTRLLWPSVCEAQVPPPLRFFALFTAHGRLDEYWQPKNGELDFDIDFEGASLQPLQPFRDQLLVLDGLDYRVLYEHGNPGHEGGPISFLTGGEVRIEGGEALAVSPSLDVVLGDALGAATRFRTLQLMSYSANGTQFATNTLSYGTGGVRLPWERDPWALWQRIFASLVTGPPSAAEVRALMRKKSLLDYLVKDASRLQSRLAGPERQKLDAHLEALRDIERRLGGVQLDCTRPAQPAPQDSAQLGDVARVPQNITLMLDLAVQALACDLTRFITFPMISQPDAPWLGITESIHDDLAHHVNDADPVRRARVRGTLNRYHRWNAENVAHLLGQLRQVSEGGGTLLDHSMVLWGNELGDPGVHSSFGVPTVIAGGCGGRFRMGRCLRLRSGADPSTGWTKAGDAVPGMVAHNQLLVSIAQAFGHDVSAFGHPDYRGALAGLS
ncbi:MAG: DUF1552 domain-containing protein [Archangiaceae bacterium]|nr:DUF1552 domain-containing protein [Archangiaceae bacterium]